MLVPEPVRSTTLIGARGLVRLQSPAVVEPAHARHGDVEDDDVGPEPRRELCRLLGARSLLDLDVHDLEGRAEQSPEGPVVVDYQETQRFPLYPSILVLYQSDPGNPLILSRNLAKAIPVTRCVASPFRPTRYA